MIRAEGKEMKADEVDGMAEATAAVSEKSKAAESARGILEKEEFLCWRQSRGSGLESSWQQRRCLRWSRSEGCVEMSAGAWRRTYDGREQRSRPAPGLLPLLLRCCHCCCV